MFLFHVALFGRAQRFRRLLIAPVCRQTPCNKAVKALQCILNQPANDCRRCKTERKKYPDMPVQSCTARLSTGSTFM
eukprot:362822-Chlamydomonas_euryale.AAC.9